MWRFSRWACLCLSLSGFQFLCFLSNSCSLFGVCMLVDVFGFVYVCVPKVNWIDCIMGVYDGLCGFGLDWCGAIRGVTILQIPQLDWMFGINFSFYFLFFSALMAYPKLYFCIWICKDQQIIGFIPWRLSFTCSNKDRNFVCFTEFSFWDLYRIDPLSNQMKTGSAWL